MRLARESLIGSPEYGRRQTLMPGHAFAHIRRRRPVSESTDDIASRQRFLISRCFSITRFPAGAPRRAPQKPPHIFIQDNDTALTAPKDMLLLQLHEHDAFTSAIDSLILKAICAYSDRSRCRLHASE